jgi:outer membrane protein assembly complex protein YaeT
MAEQETESDVPPHEGHHASARERQRRGPMFGCVRMVGRLALLVVLLLILMAFGAWWYLGSTNFADFISTKIVSTLQDRLDRKVTIGSVEIIRSAPQKVIIHDLRIANAPGAVHPYLATVKQLVITGGVESFWTRTLKIGRVDIVEPALYFEVYPAGSPLQHNFPHWQQPKSTSRFDIYHLDLGKLFVTGGVFDFLDRRHDIAATSSGIASEITVTTAKDVYEGVLTSSNLHLRVQDFVPFDLGLRTAFRYTPNKLVLQSVALDGRDMKVFLNGRLDPLADGVYNLKVTSRIALSRVREIFRVNKVLDGPFDFDGYLRGRQGALRLSGDWVSPKITADAYTLTAIKGHLNVTDVRTTVDVESARYGGGTIGAHYELPTYSEPYPQSVGLRYSGVSLDALFGAWGVTGTGLRGGATGKLSYQWNKDLVLAGSGAGNATLARNTTAFSDAKYPIPLAGAADFALDKGVVRFKRAALDTGATKVDFTGTLRIEDLFTDLGLTIHSSDFAELDQIGYNFAHSAGKQTYTLLGLGGSGDITASVRGRLKTPEVAAHVASTGTKYNNVDLEIADLDIHYDGTNSVLKFDRASFRDGKGKLGLTGTITFPDRGPSPIFDLAVDASSFPLEKAMATVNLKLAIKGLGSGRLIVTGTPDAGKVTFLNLLVREADGAELRLNGDVAWQPAKGNTSFALDIGAKAFPVADIATFLELGSNLPVTGDVTGTLHLEGPKSSLEGNGAITIHHGSVYGEAVDLATADIAFTKGTLKATNVTVTAAAGTLTGEATVDLNTNKFSYDIKSSSIDLSKIKLLSSLSGLLGGKVVLQTTGGGTFDQPEIVLTATLNDATLKGLNLPPGSPAPTIYAAIRGGRLIVKGSIADLVTIEGEGSVGPGPDLAVDGLLHITIPDIARLAAVSPATASLPASGNMVLDLRLGGKLSSLDALQLDATFPTFNLKVSDEAFVAPSLLHLSMRNGRINFDQFVLNGTTSTFAVTGSAALTGNKSLAVGIHGRVEAALLQLFIPGLRADGHINVSADVTGTLADPKVNGTAEMLDAQFKFPGFPQAIDHVTGTVVLHGDRIDIDALHATIGGGTIVAGGSIMTAGLAPKSARITLQGTSVAIRYFEGLTVEGDFNLVISGDADRIVVQGDVNVARALYFKDFDFKTSLLNVILSRRGVTPVVAASWQDRVDLRLHLVAPGTLAVRNNLADVTGTAEVDLTGTLSNPVVIGLVTLNEGGKVRFNSVDYNLTRGSINFQNPFRIDPYFDVTLEGRVNSGVSEIETGPLDVTINIQGTIDRITPTITSDPPASDITLFSLLGVGALAGRGTGGSNVDATLYGKSLLYQSVLSALGTKILPFADSFTYDPGYLDTTGSPGPKVTFEKRISTNVRLLVVYNILDHQSREIIEWTVNPNWTLQFTRDEPRSEFRIEGRFRRTYDGHWTLGKHGRPHNQFASFASVGESVALPAPLPVTDTTIPAVQTADGRVVTGIVFRADSAFDTAPLREYVSIKPGDALSIRAVQSSIRTLFATGDFRDIRVDAAPSPEGLRLTFSLFLNYRVGKISFGNLHRDEKARAQRELTIHTGDVFSLNAVDHSAVAIQDALKRFGYLEATVDPSTTFSRQRSAADIELDVIPGPLAHVGTVTIEGDVAPFTTAVLVQQMRRGPGKSFRLADARSDAERMQTYLVRRDYRKAEVRFVDDVYDPATKTVALRYHATTGPLVKVEVAGVPRGAVRRILPFRRNQEYSEDVIDAAARDIVTSYEQRGYFNATADTEEKLDPATNTWVITFHVTPGQHYNLAAVTFTGNDKVSRKTLGDVVTTSPTGGIRSLVASLLRRPTGVTRAQLSSDRDAIESYYLLHGFSEVKVATPVTVTKADGTLTVDFPIVEGPQTIVSDVAIEGMQQVSTKDLPKLLLVKGQPLNPQTVRAEVVALQVFYGSRGNVEVQVAPRTELSADKTTAKVTYVISEGPAIKVDEVIVRGNTYTDSKVVERTAGLHKGDAFSYTSILEAQRNLYRLSIFQRVDVQPEQAGTSASERNVVIQVQEGKDLTISGSAGLSVGTESASNKLTPRGSVSIAHRNLFGTGRYLGLEVVRATEDHELFLTYREPYIFNLNIPVQLTVFQSDDKRRRDTHLRQRGVFIEASKITREVTRWSLRYEYKISDCIPDSSNPSDICSQLLNDIGIPGLDRSIANIKISSLTPAFFWDHRDDPINPHRGFLTSASVEYAFPAIKAQTHFLKTFVQGSYFFPVSEGSTFAVSARFGMIHSYEVTLDDGTKTRAVPLSERFTAGGDSSHRGFPLDLLGNACTDPRDFDKNGDCSATLQLTEGGHVAPLGGSGLFLMNAEYRFPIFGPVGGAVFTDVGQVYAQPTFQLHDLRYGAGAGIRYVSPVGPLRFDIGWPLNKRSYDKPFSYFLTLGYAF